MNHHVLASTHALLDLPVNIALIDNDFKIIEASKHFEIAFGASASKHVSECQIPQRLLEDILLGTANSFELQLDDRVFRIQLSGRPAGDGYFLYAENITELANSRREQKLAQKVLQTIIETIPQYVFWKDSKSVFRGCNAKFAKSANFASPSDMIGLTDHQMPWRESAKKYIRDDQKVMDSYVPILGYEEWQESSAGAKRIVLVDKVPLTDDEGNRFVIGMYVDNTEKYKLKKNVQEATDARKLSEKVLSDFILNMQHDIRTPLAGVVGLSEIILTLESGDINEIHSATNDIIASASQLLSYCESMVEIHKSKEQLQSSTPEIIDLAALINSVYLIEKPACVKKKIELGFEVKPKKIMCIVAKNKLERILINLVSNAVKFTDQGSVMIKTEIIGEPNRREAMLRVQVIDTGIGIEAVDQEYVFQQFSKLRPSYAGKPSTQFGLGLRLAKSLVEEMNGDIYLESEVGKGSCFTVDLPIHLPLGYIFGAK